MTRELRYIIWDKNIDSGFRQKYRQITGEEIGQAQVDNPHTRYRVGSWILNPSHADAVIANFGGDKVQIYTEEEYLPAPVDLYDSQENYIGTDESAREAVENEFKYPDEW